MNKDNKLGMGLGALLSQNPNNDSDKGVQKINISQIKPNPSQPRKNFIEKDLKELATSIKNPWFFCGTSLPRVHNTSSSASLL